MKITPTAALAVLTTVACASTASRALAPEGLSYGLPEPNTVRYTFADTARYSLDSGPMGITRVMVGQAGLAELTFRREEDRLYVRADFREYSGRFRTPQGEVSADESDIRGPVGATVGARGDVVVVDPPVTSSALLDIARPLALVRPFFVPLPGRPVQPGAAWVDTVATREVRLGSVSNRVDIVTSTVMGDTLLAGRRLLQIATRSESTLTLEGMGGGVDVRQELVGSLSGRVLWDRERLLLVARWEDGTLRGTLHLPGLSENSFPVEYALQRSVLLVDGWAAEVGATPDP